MQTPELTHMQIALAPQAAGAVRAWTTGQILQATVVRTGLDGTLTLRVGQTEVQAKTGLNLAADQPLTLQVAQAGTKVVLRVLNASNTDATAPQQPVPQRTGGAPTEQLALAQAWRQVLPRTGDMRPLLQNINQQLNPQPATQNNAGAPSTNAAHAATPNATPASATTPLPPQVISALRQLLTLFPTPEKLGTASGLKRAIADSGLFLEHHLAQAAQQGTPPPVQNDLKAALTQLVANLRAQLPAATTQNTPSASTPAAPASSSPLGALLQQADAALARIEQHQLVAVSQTSTGQPPPLIVEVPVRAEPQPEVMKFVIEEEESVTEASAAKNWNVWLRFDFEALGHVEARVSLMGESVAVSLWADESATTSLFNAHISELDQTLQQAGLAPSVLPCQNGRPRSAGTNDPAPQRILDERA
jgi:hypothetical protein